MNPNLRDALEILVFVVVVSLICIAIPVQAHDTEGAGRSGIDHALLRCGAAACCDDNGFALISC